MAGMHLPSKKAKAVSRAGPGQRPQREAAGQRGLGTTTSGPHRSQSASDAGQRAMGCSVYPSGPMESSCHGDWGCLLHAFALRQ